MAAKKVKKSEELEEKVKEELNASESDFADEAILPEKEEQPKVEEPKEEPKPEVKLQKEEEEEPISNEPAPEIEDDELKAVEQSRFKFYVDYKKKSNLKTIVSVVVLLVMLAGWILPSYFLNTEEAGNAPIIISIAVCAVCLVALAVYSHFFKKKLDTGIKDYFGVFYEKTFEYAFKDLDVGNFVGKLDQKVDENEFKSSNLYKDVYKVGSRYFSTFNYKGMNLSIADAAAQTKGVKQLQTIFVGKYLSSDNKYNGKGIFVYFKGNKRAIVPNNLDALPLLEETNDYVVYGEKGESKYLTAPVKRLFAQINTNKTLVDVAISIQPGKTHFCLGYEDNLMVIPLQSKLDPRPYDEFKKNMKVFLELAEALYSSKKEDK